MSGCGCSLCGEEICPDDGRGDSHACDPDRERGFLKRRFLVRGDTLVVDFDLRDPLTCAPPSLAAAGFEAWFTLKANVRLPDLEASFQGKYTGGQIASIGGGRVRVTVPAEVTRWLPPGLSKLYYDLQVLTGTGGRIWTQERGTFEVAPDVTQNVNSSDPGP